MSACCILGRICGSSCCSFVSNGGGGDGRDSVDVGASDCVNAMKSSICMLYIGENL